MSALTHIKLVPSVSLSDAFCEVGNCCDAEAFDPWEDVPCKI